MRRAILALLAFSTLLTAQQQSTPSPSDVVIYSVGHGDKSFSIEPIVVVHYETNARYTMSFPIRPAEPTEKDFARLDDVFFKKGTPLSLFLGGKKIGAATMTGSDIIGRDGGGCVVLKGGISTTVPTIPILALNSTTRIPGHPSTRRPGTADEASTLTQFSRQWLADSGVDKALLAQGVLGPVISTELRNGAGRAIIGSFEVKGPAAIHQLFVVAEKDGPRYRLTLTSLNIGHDLDDGTDKKDQTYIDQLDLDHDGTDEIVVQSMYYESWDYTIWRFDRNSRSWQKTYTSGAGGC